MIKRIVRFLLAVVAGYIAMFLLIAVVQEGMFGGVTYQETPKLQLMAAGILTTACAVAGGAVAAVISRDRYLLPGICICGLVALETTFMIASSRLPGPVWFDVMAAASLLAGILIGGWVVKRRQVIASPAASVG